MKDSEQRINHSSFGQINFSRVSGTQRFYGSELKQHSYIELTICESELSRDLTDDRYFPKKRLVRVRMSSNQFAELITNMNTSGIPCTIEQIGDNTIEPLPFTENRKEFIHREFEERMKQFANIIRQKQIESKDLVKKKVLSKNDMESLQQNLNWIITEVEKNIPFFAKCFQETTDKVVLEAKTEIENMITHKIHTAGLEFLQEEFKNKQLKE
jgi:hypothetical protein